MGKHAESNFSYYTQGLREGKRHEAELLSMLKEALGKLESWVEGNSYNDRPNVNHEDTYYIAEIREKISNLK